MPKGSAHTVAPLGATIADVRVPLFTAAAIQRVTGRGIFAGHIAALLMVEPRLKLSVPLMGSAACGFPSPAEDYLDRSLDFNELLIAHPAATFAVSVAGESMILAGIFPGDIAIVDRAVTAVDRSVVLALVGGEFTIKRYRKKGGRVWLQAENPTFKDIIITAESEFEVWGVITKSIRML